MKAKIKKEWVKALKSGEYLQGMSVLRTKYDEYCCLGVLCDLYAKSDKLKQTQWQYDGYEYQWKLAGEDQYLPPNVVRWAGLTEKDPAANTPTGVVILSTANDNYEDFDTIAGYIEAGL